MKRVRRSSPLKLNIGEAGLNDRRPKIEDVDSCDPYRKAMKVRRESPCISLRRGHKSQASGAVENDWAFICLSFLWLDVSTKSRLGRYRYLN